MKKTKLTAAVLTAALFLSAPAAAQDKDLEREAQAAIEAARENKEKAVQEAYEAARKYKEKYAREAYQKARQAIYSKDWNYAIARLKYIIEQFKDSDYLDDSLYWLGYSMNRFSRDMGSMEKRIGEQQEALEKLNALLKKHAKSKWADDAKLLRLEIAENLVKSGLEKYRAYINGILNIKEEDPELELKLVALNSLLHMDKDKALPLLKKIVTENKNPKLRKQAIFILCQSQNDEVIPLLVKLAKDDKDSDIREQAIFWL
ncbi:MAG: HEAT repeat domain-containing protein, partial [Candidatus Aminicenantes bacterium]|nr:HEAT repeat domain-containing protein [Candidatus Aminicenantes bacterium]